MKNVKKLSGIVAVVLGVILFWFGMHAQNKVNHAKEGMNEVSGFFPKDKASNMVADRMHSKLSQYDVMIRVSKILGVVLIVGGAYVVYRYRKGR